MKSLPAERFGSWAFLALCFLFVLARFTLRGPILFFSLNYDFKVFYAASRAWSDGQNPYDHKLLNSILNKAGATAPDFTWEEHPSVCPPTTYAILSPIAHLSWRPAKLLWCLLNLAALGVFLASLYQLGGFATFRLRTFLLIGGALALQPMCAAFRVGQLSILVAALGTLALALSGTRRQASRGFLLAIALSLKPQLALGFFAPDVISRRWRTYLAGGLTLLVIGTIAVFRMHSPMVLLGAWLSNVRAAFGLSGVNTIDPSSPHNRNLVNLQYPFRLIISTPWTVNALSVVIAALLVLPALRILRNGDIAGSLLLETMSLVVAVELLSMYHRDYDAVLLAIPLAWALSPKVSLSRALPAILMIAVFFFPFLHLLYALDASISGHPLSASLFWRFLAWPYQTWVLLALAAWLSYCCAHAEEESTQIAHVGTQVPWPSTAGSGRAPVSRI